MNPYVTKYLGKALSVAAAGAVALGLAACDEAPPQKISKSFDSIVEEAGRNAEQASAAVVNKAAQSHSAGSDAALAARVKAALAADSGLRSITVDVNAAGGVVTLYGTADTPATSHQAAMVAMNVEGVRSVKNAMIIVRGS